MTVPTVVVTLEGGVITSIDTSHQVRFVIVDHDARENGEARHELNGERVFLTDMACVPDETGFVDQVKAALL